MRTNASLPAAAQRSLLLLLGPALVLFTVAPGARAAGLQSPPGQSIASAYMAHNPGQQSYPTPQRVKYTTSTSVTELLDTSSISPETLGDLLMIHRHYLAAIEAYQHAPQSSAVICNKLGIAYQHMYALDFAKLQYEKALSINPKYAEALNNLGTIYYGEQNYHKAEKYYRKAIHLNHHNAPFYSNLGTAYFAEHHYKRGIASYRKAFKIDPQVFLGNSRARVEEMGPPGDQVRLNYALAELCAQAGMADEAIHYLRLAFIAGFNNRKKLMNDAAFAKMLHTAKFQLLLTEEHIKMPNNSEQSLVAHSGQTTR
ncbi:MAG TPA: tetratricopeptide repeat protein [Acidobacteriaceae bacterium]|nr:tetratricopeptide repeat protein [Acidobacteriaceae bacterium]